MNLIGAMVLDVHARIAAEHRGEKPLPQARWCLKTVANNNDTFRAALLKAATSDEPLTEAEKEMLGLR